MKRAACLLGRFRASAAVLAVACAAMSGLARAQTDEIQVYDAEIAAKGVFNLTWHNNFTTSGSRIPAFPGGVEPYHSLNGVPEWAVGLTDWFEGGLYLPLYTRTSNGSLLFNGMKLRLLFVSPDAAQRQFFYGVNFEFSYNTRHWNEDRYTSEIRPIAGWHWGRVDFIVNPILDNSYKGFSRLDFAPATRLAFNLSRQWALAAEEYDDFGPLRHFYPSGQQAHQLFAVADYRGAAYTLEAGIGFGLTAGTDHRVLKLIISHDL